MLGCKAQPLLLPARSSLPRSELHLDSARVRRAPDAQLGDHAREGRGPAAGVLYGASGFPGLPCR